MIFNLVLHSPNSQPQLFMPVQFPRLPCAKSWTNRRTKPVVREVGSGIPTRQQKLQAAIQLPHPRASGPPEIVTAGGNPDLINTNKHQGLSEEVGQIEGGCFDPEKIFD